MSVPAGAATRDAKGSKGTVYQAGSVGTGEDVPTVILDEDEPYEIVRGDGYEWDEEDDFEEFAEDDFYDSDEYDDYDEEWFEVEEEEDFSLGRAGYGRTNAASRTRSGNGGASKPGSVRVVAPLPQGNASTDTDSIGGPSTGSVVEAGLLRPTESTNILDASAPAGDTTPPAAGSPAGGGRWHGMTLVAFVIGVGAGATAVIARRRPTSNTAG